MPIQNIVQDVTGLVGVSPNFIYIYTNDTLMEVLETGYLTESRSNGYTYNNAQMALVYTSDDNSVLLQISVSSDNSTVSLKSFASDTFTILPVANQTTVSLVGAVYTIGAAQNIGITSTPTFENAIFTELAGVQVVATNIGGELISVPYSSLNVSNNIVLRDGSGNFSSEVITGTSFLGNGGTLTGQDPTTSSSNPLNTIFQNLYNYTNSAVQGLGIKAACNLATTANITLSGEQTIDGVLTSSSRVLVKNQSISSQNGIYTTSSGAWTRTSDFAAGTNQTGAYTFIESGTMNGGSGWVFTSFTNVGTSSSTVEQFSSAGTYTAGTGLTLTGTVFSLNQATASALGGVIVGTNISVSSGTISVPTATPSVLGVCSPDNATIVSSTGVYSVSEIPTTAVSSNASFYPLMVSSATNSNQTPSLSSGLSFNPSTNSLTTTTFVGALTGNASTATTATTATNIAGGANGSIPYQTGAGTTSMLSTSSGVLIGGTPPSYTSSPTLANLTLSNGGALQTDTTSGHTLLNQAYNNTSSSYSVFVTLMAGSTPSYALNVPSGCTGTIDSVTIGSNTPVQLQGYRPINSQSGTTYTLVLSDSGKLITLNNSSAITLTVPPNSSVAFPVGTEVDICALGSGKVTVSPGSGVTLNSINGVFSLAAQYAGGTLKQVSANSWVLFGSIVS